MQSTTNEKYLLQDDGADNSSLWIVIRKMLFFTVLMTVAPLASFFIAKDYVFQAFFNVSTGNSYTYSAVVAVIVVHIVLISFLFVAFYEHIPEKKNVKDSTGKTD